MRKYCVVLIAIIMLMPAGEIRASEATMVASLSIMPMEQMVYESMIKLPQQDEQDAISIVWGAPTITVAVRGEGGHLSQVISSGSVIDLSMVGDIQEVSMY